MPPADGFTNALRQIRSCLCSFEAADTARRSPVRFVRFLSPALLGGLCNTSHAAKLFTTRSIAALATQRRRGAEDAQSYRCVMAKRLGELMPWASRPPAPEKSQRLSTHRCRMAKGVGGYFGADRAALRAAGGECNLEAQAPAAPLGCLCFQIPLPVSPRRQAADRPACPSALRSLRPRVSASRRLCVG
jgi:hypothetical protein